ncbi:MAG: SBBP repeat-containing protein [Vicinamibacteraceae bacterium]
MPRYTASILALGALATLSSGRVAAAPESPRPPVATNGGRPSALPIATPTISRPTVPLRFEPLAPADNGSRVFVARSAGHAVHVGPTWVEVHATDRPDATRATPAEPIALRFVGAVAGPREVSLEGAATTVNYLVGADPDRWHIGLEARGRVRFRDVYPGIDVAYYGNDRQVEYDILVDPGADPDQVRLRLSGAGHVAITADGDLELGAPGAPVRVRAPFAYQLEGPARVPIASRYLLHADGTVGFALGRFDRRRALVIDPILSYSTLLGGSGLDEAASVAVDAAGNVYVAGTTSSPGFPGASGGPGGIDLFVTKLDARGSTVLFSTYIGGSGIDEARGMTIDGLGNVYVVGSTTSTNFPTVSPRQATLAGAADGFLLRISTTGGGLGFSTYLGGADVDETNAVAVDAGRNMYIAGTTRSANFPQLNPIQAFGGGLDGFVARFAASGTLTYSTYHGGNGVDTLDGIGVDAAGNINTVGSTSSTNLPVLSAQRPTSSGRVDAFMSRFGPTGTLLFCSYYGGSRNDVGRAIAVLPSGWAFVGGTTASPDFPVVSAIQPAFGGELDAFLLAVSPTGGVAWSTFYGGTRSERGRALAVNQAGKLIFAGQTFSSDMPLLRPAQPRTGGNRDTFVVELDPPYTAFTYATYLGGSNNDEGSGVAVDRVGRVFTAGAASYPSPGTLGASDAFIYGISSGLAGVDTDGDGMDDEWETRFGTDPNTNDAAADPDGDGFTNAQELASNTHPTGYFTRYLAEGSTGAFFDDRIALFNPGVDVATVMLRFQRDVGAELQQVLAIPGRSRATVNPEIIVGLENAAFATVIESNQQVVVDRTMTWDGTGFGSHAETSIEQPATTWYLAEGSTAGTFDLYYLLQNPNASAAQVTITFLRPSGGPVTKSYTVNPRSRRTINIDSETGFVGRPATERTLQSTDVSATITSTNGVPILVERAMYMTVNGRVFAAGHDSAGVTAPQTSWFLAEGATGSFFDLFILLANPTSTATTVEITYLLSGGTQIVRQYGLPAQSRRTVYVDSQPGLANVATSAIVRSLSASVPIVVERAMWWPDGNWAEAHNSAGAIVTSPKWALADGEVGGTTANQTFVLVANTSPFTATVRATAFFEDQGSPLIGVYAIPPNTRFNVDYSNSIAQGRRFSVLVEGFGPTQNQEPQLVVERAMYSNSGTVVWAAGTDALGTPIFPPATFTVTPNGLFPKVLVVDESEQITIVNRDPDQADTIDCTPGGHDISDDPHPTHGDNPEFGVGRLTLNQSRLTQNLVTPGAFGVHDHCHGSDSRFFGRVIVRFTP